MKAFKNFLTTINSDELVKDFARYAVDDAIDNFNGIENVPNFSEAQLKKIVRDLINRMLKDKREGAKVLKLLQKNNKKLKYIEDAIDYLWWNEKKIAKIIHLALKKMK